jgi:flavin reductase (DIM6/NTAB) family NADH-FMN oxidoreductase RutF
MGKTKFKSGNMLYPLPAVMVSCGDIHGVSNILTVAWTGTLCTNPPMAYIAVRPERHSYHMIRESGEFVINLTTKKLARATDFCGVRSGKNHNKWADCHLTPIKADTVKCPMIGESPVNIECKVGQVLELGSHHVFVANVTGVHVDDRFLDKKGTFHLEDAGLITYSHGTYFDLGKSLGSFGYSVRKKTDVKKRRPRGKR